jgi:hypothetical protein
MDRCSLILQDYAFLKHDEIVDLFGSYLAAPDQRRLIEEPNLHRLFEQVCSSSIDCIVAFVSDEDLNSFNPNIDDGWHSLPCTLQKLA